VNPRRACRKDNNHDVIADAFRRHGWDWYETYQFAQYLPGFPDGMAVRNGMVVLVEIKNGDATLTPDEERFIANYHAPVIIARSVEDVERLEHIALSWPGNAAQTSLRKDKNMS